MNPIVRIYIGAADEQILNLLNWKMFIRPLTGLESKTLGDAIVSSDPDPFGFPPAPKGSSTCSEG